MKTMEILYIYMMSESLGDISLLTMDLHLDLTI